MSSADNLHDYDDELKNSLQIDYGSHANVQAAANHQQHSYGPKDKYHFVRICMYLFGISCLLPWNFFIQANDYWQYKLRNVSADGLQDAPKETELQITFPSYMAIASKVPYVIFLLVNSAIATRIVPEKRMQYPLIVMIGLFVIVVAMVPINMDESQNAFFAITICLIISINVMCGFVQGAGTGIAGAFPKVYTEYYVSGMAIGGILASTAQILSLVGNNTPIQSAIMYFVSATLILCITFVLFRILMKTEFYVFYMSKQASAEVNRNKKVDVSSVAIFKKVWVYAVSVTLIFWVSLSLIPAVVSQVQSSSTTESIWTGRLFLPVAFFLVFNICDLGGRIISTQMPIPSRFRYVTLALTVCRIVFIPLIMLCNTTTRNHLPVIFNSDVSFIIITTFFSLSNGYLCNVALSQAPKLVEEKHQEIVGTQMAFFLGLGLMLGSVISYGLVKLL